MNPRSQALLARAVLGLVLVELPVLTIWLSQPTRPPVTPADPLPPH